MERYRVPASTDRDVEASNAEVAPPEPSVLLALQRTAGNHAVSALVARDRERVHEAAADRAASPAGPLPFAEPLQSAFGAHDLSGVRAHVGPKATANALAAGAQAYASGEDVVFAGTPDLHTTAHEAAHVVQQRAGVEVPGGVGTAGDRYERQADAVAAAVTAGRSAVPLLGPPSPRSADRAGAPVQRVDHASPTSATIAQAMTAAGITDFGPYVWDDTVPRFKLDPTYPAAAWTLADCVSAAVHEPEIYAVAGEKGASKQSLISTRRAKALAAVFGATQGVVDKIMQHNSGTAPRAFVDLAIEDGYSSGHSAERHILGTGVMTGHREVALRAAFQAVNGVQMDLDKAGPSAGTSSVFASNNEATTAVQAAITGELTTNWAAHRKTLAKGTHVKITVPQPVQCVAYTKYDAPKGTKYPEAIHMPGYIDATKPGDRELYPGDHTNQPNPPDKAKDPLTTGGAETYNNLYVVIVPSPSYVGGWAIYTAYPKK